MLSASFFFSFFLWGGGDVRRTCLITFRFGKGIFGSGMACPCSGACLQQLHGTVGNQCLTHVKEMAGDDDEHMSKEHSRRTMGIILGTMGTTLGNDGSMPNIEGTT